MKKDYGFLDIMLILSGVLVVTISGVLYNSKWYVILNTILCLLCVFTQAKGKIINQFIGIVHFVLYIFICYNQKFYGEALLYLVVMTPLYIYGIINWLKNRDYQNNAVMIRSS